MKILVTGGSGYIGSHTCLELLMAGHDVVAIDNLSNSKAVVFDRIERICGRRAVFCKEDVRNGGKVAEILAEHGIEAVIHFAGLKAVGESVAQPLRYYEQQCNRQLGTVQRDDGNRGALPGIQFFRHGLRQSAQCPDS